VRIELTGDEEVRAVFRSMVPRLQNVALAKLAQAVYEDVEKGVAPHEVPKPGRANPTRRLWQSLYKRKASNDSWEVGHDPKIADYARYVLYGTRPHEIRPKNRRSLRWASGVGFIFAKFVKHPGTKADPYLVRSAQKAKLLFESIILKMQANKSWYNSVAE
jgi:hypothetical protein